MIESMASPIQLDSVSKLYRIFSNPQDRFKQALMDRFHKLFGSAAPSPLYREHWALRDITFELHPGEAVGILGRNGAGKSTLLQIIAGTLEPTSGVVNTSGRITALLELGSGFNPEFTGRENVVLNAQILGMSRNDALDRFDDIASFADIGDFIDQPVKTYSSGMMMRLAFAVQTAVEPRVLIVDEALSVGDMFFQAKCMARIRKLVDDGVAILFVSHDTGAIRQLCARAILLDHGQVKVLGETRLVADNYVKQQLEDRNRTATGQKAPDVEEKSVSPLQEIQLAEGFDISFGKAVFDRMAESDRTGNGWACVENVQMLFKGQYSIEFGFGDTAEIIIAVRFFRTLLNVNISFKVRTLQGMDVLFFDTRLQDRFGQTYLGDSVYVFNWHFELPLMHGSYALAVGVACPPAVPGNDWVFVDMVPHAYDFRMRPRQEGMIGGFVTLPAALEVKRLEIQV